MERKYEPESVRAKFSRGEGYVVINHPWETHLYITNELAKMINTNRLKSLSKKLFPDEERCQILNVEQYEHSLRISFPPLEENKSKLIEKIKGDLAA